MVAETYAAAKAGRVGSMPTLEPGRPTPTLCI